MRTLRLLVLIALLGGIVAAELTGDPVLDAARSTYEKKIEVIRSKADQELAKAKSELDAAYQAAIKRAMAKGDLAAANALKAEMDGEKGAVGNVGQGPLTLAGIPAISDDAAQRIDKSFKKLTPGEWEKLPGSLLAVVSTDQQNGGIVIDKPMGFIVIPHPGERWKDEDKPTGEFYDYAGFSKETNKSKDGIAMQVVLSAATSVQKIPLKRGLVIQAKEPCTLFLGTVWENNGVGIKHSGSIRVKILAIK